MFSCLSIVVILPPGRECFYAKCAQFPLILNGIKLIDGLVSSGTVIIHFLR